MNRNLNSVHPKTFAVWHPDAQVRNTSSSGGAFTLLAEEVIRRGGIVFGAAWISPEEVSIVKITDGFELNRLRGSKYVAATLKNVYSSVKESLEQGVEVLYSGTPCQVAGLYQFLGKDYSNLLTVDVLCHGAPNARVWKKYVRHLNELYRDNIKSINFRDKRLGCECNLLLVLTLESGKEKIVLGKHNTYYYGFINNMFMRKCCMQCKFNLLPRVADFSLADFRGLGDRYIFEYESEKPKGITGVLVNNERASTFLKRLDLTTWKERPFEELSASQSVLRENAKPHPRYFDFWKEFETQTYSELEQKYLRPPKGYLRYILLRRILRPRLFMLLGTIYKRIRGLRTTSFLPLSSRNENKL